MTVGGVHFIPSRETPRPKVRSKVRLALGKWYFCGRRYLVWMANRSRYARYRPGHSRLPHVCFEHRTPLLRRLANVDMWLQHNKVVNLRLAVARLDGVVLRPGETFSFWRLVGRPTRRKGYVEGMVLFNKSFYPGVGGGLCQLSNLIYWMTLHTPLTVTERWRHSYDYFPDANRTQPFGSGATVVYNYIDLQIRNDTDADYQLVLRVGDTDLEGQWRSVRPPGVRYRVYEAAHRITHEWWGCYVRHNIIRRESWTWMTGTLNDEYVTENHAIMVYEPLLPPAQGEDTRPSLEARRGCKGRLSSGSEPLTMP